MNINYNELVTSREYKGESIDITESGAHFMLWISGEFIDYYASIARAMADGEYIVEARELEGRNK